jgi:uncharacterized membrane protein YdjX (TVP38/TMEM64 family)
MFKQQEAANVMLTWILRLVGYLLMAFGIFLVAQPFATFADVLPFLGDFVTAAIAVFAALAALPFALITIALGWVFYRPLVGIPMLAVGLLGVGVLAYLVVKRLKARKNNVDQGRGATE